MQQAYGIGRLVPTGKRTPSMNVSYNISHQLIETKHPNGSFLRQRAVVHSIAPEAGRQIDLGDFDLLIGDQMVRLKHVDNDPEWLVLSSDISSVCD